MVIDYVNLPESTFFNWLVSAGFPSSNCSNNDIPISLTNGIKGLTPTDFVVRSKQDYVASCFQAPIIELKTTAEVS